MKALVLHSAGDIRYEPNWPEPKVPPGWVLVRVKYSGICGSDLPRIFQTGAYQHPRICGHEFMGYVEDAPRASTYEQGDRVAVLPLIPCGQCESCKDEEYFHCAEYDFLGSRRDGGFAEYCAVPECNLLPLPDGVDDRTGAFIEPMAVAQHVVNRSQFTGNSRMLILGAGSIGLLVAMWLRYSKASTIDVADIREESLAIAHSAGFTTLINPIKEDISKLDEYDYIYEAAGSTAALLAAIQAAKREGTITVVGREKNDIVIPIRQFESFMRKEVTLNGCWGYEHGRNYDSLIDAMRSGQFVVHPLITHEIPLEEAPKVLREMNHREIFFCKVMLQL